MINRIEDFDKSRNFEGKFNLQSKILAEISNTVKMCNFSHGTFLQNISISIVYPSKLRNLSIEKSAKIEFEYLRKIYRLHSKIENEWLIDLTWASYGGEDKIRKIRGNSEIFVKSEISFLKISELPKNCSTNTKMTIHQV